MSKHTVSYIDKNGKDHRLDIDFDYTVGNDGIGEYEYWGCRCYDAGSNYIEEVNINKITLVRECLKASRREDIPKGAFEIRKDKNGNGWTYSMGRKIDPDGAYTDYCIERIEEEYDFEGDEPELDYEEMYERRYGNRSDDYDYV